MKKRTSDRQLKVLSVIVAIILRAYIITTTNPTSSKTFRGIPLVINDDAIGSDQGYKLAEDGEPTVTVKLSSRRNEMANLSEEDIAASVKLEGGREGIETVNVEVDVPSGVKIDSVEPKSLNFRVENVVEKEFPIKIEVAEELKEGKLLELKDMSDKYIKISGLRSSVDSVEKVICKVDDEKYLDGNRNDLNLSAIDKDGNEVKGVTLSKETVSLQYDCLVTRDVDVKLVSSGEVPSNYKITSLNISPSHLTIKGKEEDLDGIESIRTKPISLTNVKNSISGEVDLDLPRNVKLVDEDQKISYKLEVEKK